MRTKTRFRAFIVPARWGQNDAAVISICNSRFTSKSARQVCAKGSAFLRKFSWSVPTRLLVFLPRAQRQIENIARALDAFGSVSVFDFRSVFSVRRRVRVLEKNADTTFCAYISGGRTTIFSIRPINYFHDGSPYPADDGVKGSGGGHGCFDEAFRWRRRDVSGADRSVYALVPI